MTQNFRNNKRQKEDKDRNIAGQEKKTENGRKK